MPSASGKRRCSGYDGYGFRVAEERAAVVAERACSVKPRDDARAAAQQCPQAPYAQAIQKAADSPIACPYEAPPHRNRIGYTLMRIRRVRSRMLIYTRVCTGLFTHLATGGGRRRYYHAGLD
ncbi:hypothetical protein THASP1DRAFT_23507 [Thamnocephalis sphaerospora]|uniref:Uncharacterized protein n=1 Tax=Thamnocephalis sphaerospora TaxID=78915 RepID=A0A4P9XSP0_9FUNG|nr:hypothetical protein THASP1DRAFT_23507 [Thamnocephalis sphaerospora]|eukprot:RKP08511.1 hypothetical protein THASP1DRAFT_23507 [Thamnocephalis sphaerospora]